MAVAEERAGRLEQAVAWGRRAVELAPSRADEAAHRRLLELLHRSGESAAAVRAYHAFSARLTRELDVEPSPRLRELVSGIRGSAAAASAVARGHCLRARHFQAQRTPAGLARARREFLGAIEASPGDPLGYAGLAEVCALLPWYAGGDSACARSWADAAAARALELDCDLAGPRAVRAAAAFWFAGERDRTDDTFGRALDLDPGHPTTRHWYSLILVERGQFEAAAVAAGRAWTLDPASAVVGTDYATVLFWTRRYEEALIQLEAALELEPRFYLAHERRWRLLAALGRYEEATRAIVTALGLECIGERAIDAVQEAWATQGWERVLELRLSQTAPAGRASGAAALPAAVLCGLLGRTRQALDWLEQASACGSPALGLGLAEPAFDSMRACRRFRALVAVVRSRRLM